MRTNGYLEASGAWFTKNRKCYLWATYDKWNVWQTYDNGRGVFRKSYIRPITENDANLLFQFVCHLAMLEGFDSFYNYVNYDEVTKTHNMQLCVLDEGPFNLKMLQFFSEYPAMGVHPLLLEWHGSVMTICDAR